MQDKVDQFLNLVNGKYIEAEDASNYAQCMDLAFKWLDTLGIPRDTIRHLYAYQVWTNPYDSTRKYFNLIPNGPTNTPKPGSLVIFGQSVGPAGHISIESGKSNSKDAITIDQNWGNPKYSRLVTHAGYKGVLGWLEPKVSGQTATQKLAQIWPLKDQPGTDEEKLAKIKQIVA